QGLPGLEGFSENKGVDAYEDMLTINGKTFQAAVIATGLSKPENFINEMLDNAASVENLNEEERQERTW
ncbi:hypothetical protein TNCV_2193071, partial [Trichonephila clavipes]